jgi:hypothetical protein
VRRQRRLSEITVFLKDAKRDPNIFLSADGVDNEEMLLAAADGPELAELRKKQADDHHKGHATADVTSA